MTVSAENSMSQWTILHPNNTDQSGARNDNDGVLLDDFAKKIFILVNHVIADMCICIFGIVGNCLNITVFLKQGLHKSVNLSLFAMSISDLTGLSFQVWHNFCLNPYLELANLPFDFLEIQMLTAGRPSILMVRVTGWITMYITAERCLSVVLPLKIREIITYKRTAINLLLMFGINLAFYLPVTSSDYVTWKFYPILNKTQLGLSFRGNKPTVEWLINTSHFYLSLFAFIFVIIFTAVLVISLRRKSKWRKGATSATDQREARTSRENKTIALVIMVAFVLIVCYAPGVCCAITEALYPEFGIVAKQSNFYQEDGGMAGYEPVTIKKPERQSSHAHRTTKQTSPKTAASYKFKVGQERPHSMASYGMSLRMLLITDFFGESPLNNVPMGDG